MKITVRFLTLVLTWVTLHAQANTLTIITPQSAGNTGTYFPLQNAFDGQPVWDNSANQPLSDSNTSGNNAPSYTERLGYIDFGEDFRHLRITQTWTRYRSWSGGDHNPFNEMWWDNDNDEFNDGLPESQIAFNSAQGLAHRGDPTWQPDLQLTSEQAIIPKGRFLMIKSPATNLDRAMEFAFVGWFDDYAPPPPQMGAKTPLLTMPSPDSFDYAKLTLVDEVTFGQPDTTHAFKESVENISQIQPLLGQTCRVLPNDSDGGKYFAYQLGKDRNLSAGKAYVLVVDYPEDQPRSMVVVNHGGEINRGFHTGNTVGDALYPPYEKPIAESLHYGLSQQVRSMEQFFHLHDRFPDLETKPRGTGDRNQLPKDGFWVAISQFGKNNGPLSKGAAVCRIALYEAPTDYQQPLTLPPEGLPQRQLFYREEMSDSAVNAPLIADRAVADPVDWYEYKARLLTFLGMNTYTQDLLEFGHNQGWDVGPYSAKDEQWYVMSQYPHRWEHILNRLMNKGYPLNILPYYEYAGSDGADGLGTEKVSKPLTRDDQYTHSGWSEKANIDVSDSRAVADALKLLDATLVSQFKGQRPVPKDVEQPSGLGYSYREGWGYIDLGPNYADWRIQQGWTRSRLWHGGPATPYKQVLWYNGAINEFDKQTLAGTEQEPTINFITKTQSNQSYAWSQDFNLNLDNAITPKGRYLLFETATGFTSIHEALLLGSHKDTPQTLQRLSVAAGAIDSNHDMALLFDNQPEFNQAKALNVSGIWLRPRVSAIPQGFGAPTLARFAATLPQPETGILVLTKQDLIGDSNLLAQYYAWWNAQRQDFLNQIKQHVRDNVNPDAVVLFTADSSECGAKHPTENVKVITDDVSDWSGALASTPVLPLDQALERKLHEQAQRLPYATWGGWEFHHSAPRADIDNYQNSDGVMMTYTFNDLYTVSNTGGLQAFNTKSGTAAIRHYCLNEDAMATTDKTPLLGYFVADVELAGPYITLPEARAVANGDPHYFGYLSSNSFNRGFPGYVRQFNANYLALPALASVRRDDLSTDTNIVVRTITTAEHGTWMAVINTGLEEVFNAKISLPISGAVFDAVTSTPVDLVDGKLELDLYPGQLMSLRVLSPM